MGKRCALSGSLPFVLATIDQPTLAKLRGLRIFFYQACVVDDHGGSDGGGGGGGGVCDVWWKAGLIVCFGQSKSKLSSLPLLSLHFLPRDANGHNMFTKKVVRAVDAEGRYKRI